MTYFLVYEQTKKRDGMHSKKGYYQLMMLRAIGIKQRVRITTKREENDDLLARLEPCTSCYPVSRPTIRLEKAFFPHLATE